MRIRIYPYRQGSKSAKALATGLGGRVLRLEGSTFVPRHNDVIINWGSSQCPPFEPTLINWEIATRKASNKRLSFEALAKEGVSTPSFAATKDSVSWDGLVVVRHKLTGHSGEGIEIVNHNAGADDLPDAPLYVQYIPKKDEYRVHIIGTSIIAVQRKARRLEVEEPNWRVRNHANGFVFVRNDVNAPESVLSEATKAIAALGLDFGAVDVIWNEKQGAAYVLEVNTAPGLEGQTVDDYVNGFKEYLSHVE